MMSDKNKPAFPRSETGSAETGQIDEGAPGMTLREHYAGLAMVGLLAMGPQVQPGDEEMAKVAFRKADAMIAELQREDTDDTGR